MPKLEWLVLENFHSGGGVKSDDLRVLFQNGASPLLGLSLIPSEGSGLTHKYFLHVLELQHIKHLGLAFDQFYWIVPDPRQDKLKSLRSLHVDYINTAWMSQLTTWCENLQRIEIQTVDMDGMTRNASMLATLALCSNLEELKLGGGQPRDDTVASLLAFAKSTPQLRMLDIRDGYAEN